jgi:hypothetical protein
VATIAKFLPRYVFELVVQVVDDATPFLLAEKVGVQVTVRAIPGDVIRLHACCVGTIVLNEKRRETVS